MADVVITTSGGTTGYLRVQAAFGHQPLSTTLWDSTSWTDIGTDVRSIHIDRGRSHELDEFNAGACILTIDNNDGDWTAGTTGGTYGSTNVLPGLPIRVQAKDWGGSSYSELCLTFVENIGMEFGEAGSDWTVTLDTVDGMKYLEMCIVYDGTTYAAEDEATRIHNVLANVGWGYPTAGSTWPGKTLGLTTLVVDDAFDNTALALIRKAADAANGEFAIDRTGQPHYWPRTKYSNISTSTRQTSLTFSDTGGAVNFRRIGWHYDDINVFNDIIVDITGRPQDRSVTTSTVSMDKYGIRSLSRAGLPISSTAERDSIASWLLDRWKETDVRPVEITVMPTASPSVYWDACSQREVGDIITLNHTAAGISTDVSIEGIVHDIKPGKQWETTFRLAPIVEVSTY